MRTMIFSAPQSPAGEISFGDNALVNQDMLAEMMLGGNYVTSCEPSTEHLFSMLRFTANYDGAYYALSENVVSMDDMVITVNGETVDYKYSDDSKRIFFIGTFKKGDDVFISSANYLIGEIFDIYYIDTDAPFKDCLAAKEHGINLKNTQVHDLNEISSLRTAI